MEYDLNDFRNLIGDFNNDGILNDQDLSILIDSIINSSELNENLNLNSDSTVDIFDILALIDLVS